MTEFSGPRWDSCVELSIGGRFWRSENAERAGEEQATGICSNCFPEENDRLVKLVGQQVKVNVVRLFLHT